MTGEPIVLIVTITPNPNDAGTADQWRDNVADALTTGLSLDAAFTVDVLTFPTPVKIIGRDEPFAWRDVAAGKAEGLCCATSDPVTPDGARFLCTRPADHPPPHKAHNDRGEQLAAWIGDTPK